MPIDTRSDIEIEDLISVIDGLNETCDFGECGLDASWHVVCSVCDKGEEATCHGHYVILCTTNIPLTFNGSCGHTVYPKGCKWVKL